MNVYIITQSRSSTFINIHILKQIYIPLRIKEITNTTCLHRIQVTPFASSMCQPSQEVFSHQPPQGSGRTGFLVDEVITGQAFLQVLRDSLVSIIPPMPNTRSSTAGVV